MWFLLILGAASLVLNRFRLQPDTTSWSGFFFGIGVWAGALALCALLLRGISGAHDFLKAAVAMWRPLVLLGVAGYVLFFNDQGRELGISLMGEKTSGQSSSCSLPSLIGPPTRGKRQGSGSTLRLSAASSAFSLHSARSS